MKKLFSVFTALFLILPCFSCSDTKKPDNSSDITGEPIENETEEKQFMTYSSKDFKKIDVPWNETDSEPPVELKCYEFPDYDFGERIPPCMSSDDPMQYYYDYENYEAMENEADKKEIYDEFMKNANKPQHPFIERVQRDGNKSGF